jgi:hypothetical protein
MRHARPSAAADRRPAPPLPTAAQPERAPFATSDVIALFIPAHRPAPLSTPVPPQPS